jgi:hypothetical protein
MLKRRRRSRCPRYQFRWPAVIAGSAGWAGAAALLVATGALVGGARLSLGSPLGDIERATAKPACAAFVVFAALLFGAWSFRRLWQEFLT